MKFKVALLLLVVVSVVSCTKKCESSTASVYVENLSSSDYPVRLSIEDVNSNIQNTNNFINPGNKSESLSFPAGLTRYNITINKSGTYSSLNGSYQFESCGRYVITVGTGSSVSQAIIKKLK